MAAAKREGNWVGILKDQKMNLELSAYRERSKDEVFPWDVTDHGVGKKSLYKVYSRAIFGAKSGFDLD
jgi:hypothetical protein